MLVILTVALPPLSSSNLNQQCSELSAVPKGGFPLLRNFYEGTRVSKIEAMYRRSSVNVKVERGSIFAFTRDLPYIASVLFTRVPT